MFLPKLDPGERSYRASAATALMILTALAVLVEPVQAQQSGSILGRITTAGEPLAGVSVVVVGTTLSGTSDGEGRYLIVAVPVGTHQVRTSMLGYGPRDVEVAVTAGGAAVANFQLQTRAVQLEGVVVTGTAIASQRREIGNSIDLITSADIEASGASNVEDILRGRIQGLQVAGSNATPGVGAELNIRGLTSINGRRSPLIYVDGVRVGTEDGAFDPSTGETGVMTALGSISPQDIERIEVIKGAAASTLYGTDATAGVIQIFTKRGGAGERAQWTYSSQVSLTTPPMFGPGEDIDPTGLHMNRCDINGPLPQDTIPGGDPDCPESGSWFKNAWSQNHNLQVRGGSEDFAYFVSGGLENQQGIINVPSAEVIGIRKQPPGSQAKNAFLRANFTFDPFESMQLQVNTAYTRRNVDFVPDGEGSTSLVRNVTELHFGDTPDDRDGQVFLFLENQAVDQYVISASANWLPMDNMRHRLNVGFDRSVSTRIEDIKRGHFAAPLGERAVDIEGSRVITLDYAGSLVWEFPSFDDYSFTSSWGGQLNDRQADGLRGDAEDFINRGRTQLEQAAERTNLNESYSAFINGGFFAQQMIGWNNQIFLTGGLRFDTYNTVNELLEATPEYQIFPKLQATYTISDHSWFPTNVIETFRLRTAWGTAGDPPPQTASRTLWDIRATGRGNVGYNVNQIGNTDIGPERTTEWEAGADISALEGRINLAGQYFYRSTRDGLIFNDPIPSLGIIEPTPANLGEWDAWGYEATLDANVVDLDRIRWNVNTTLSFQDSEIKSIGLDEDGSFNVGEGGNDGFAAYRIGSPMGAVFVDEMLNENERGVLPVYTDTAVFRGVQVAPYELSVGTSFGIGNRLTLDFFGFGQFGHVLVDGQAVSYSEDGLWPACVRVNELMDAWRAAGADETAVPQELTAGEIGRCDEVGNPDTRDWYDNADFFRFSSASAQFLVPDTWLPGVFTGATVQFQALNLNLFTNFNGTDPDAIRGAGLQQRSRALGFIIPAPRTYSLNVRLNF